MNTTATPIPDKKGMSWKEFISSHLDVTWATDFFTEEVWTLGGLITFYVLFFIHLGSRRVYIAGCTPHTNAPWAMQQARNFSMLLNDIPDLCHYLIHDRDTSFIPFDHVIRTDGIKVIKTPIQSPQCNSYAERFVLESRETLNKMIPLGEHHFRHILKCIETHHNRERPHQGLCNRLIEDAGEKACGGIQCRERLGGMLRYYYRKAA